MSTRVNLAGAGLGLLALLLWVLALATIADLRGSDPAGNALAQAYAAVEIVLLWASLLALVMTAAIAGALPNRPRSPRSY